MGPKDIDILQKVNPKLGQIVDWGFFGILAHPLFTSLNWVHDHWTGNFGWAIILVTLIINVGLFPLRLSSLKSARRMQKLQPQIQAINAKYKNISLRDPKKAEQNQEVMALYKQEGVNPVGGCLPMIIQLPFFYAFYRVLNIAIELRHAPWLWVPDLSSAETLPIHLLPLILIAHPVPDSAYDSCGRRRPESAEDDAHDAALFRLHVLPCLRWACTILVNR